MYEHLEVVNENISSLNSYIYSNYYKATVTLVMKSCKALRCKELQVFFTKGKQDLTPIQACLFGFSETKQFVSSDFEQGAINSSSGSDHVSYPASNIRIRTNKNTYFRFSMNHSSVTLQCSSELKVFLWVFSEPGIQYGNYHTYYNGSLIPSNLININYLYQLSVGYTDNSAITTSDIVDPIIIKCDEADRIDTVNDKIDTTNDAINAKLDKMNFAFLNDWEQGGYSTSWSSTSGVYSPLEKVVVTNRIMIDSTFYFSDSSGSYILHCPQDIGVFLFAVDAQDDTNVHYYQEFYNGNHININFPVKISARYTDDSDISPDDVADSSISVEFCPTNAIGPYYEIQPVRPNQFYRVNSSDIIGQEYTHTDPITSGFTHHTQFTVCSCKFEVFKDDVIHVQGKSGAFYLYVITDLEDTIIDMLSTSSTFISKEIHIEQDGYVYFNHVNVSGEDSWVGILRNLDYNIISTYVDNKLAETRKEISILALGNSFTQDALTYVPYVINAIAPNIDLNLGISYHGGASLSDQINDYNNNLTCEFDYKDHNSDAWVKYSSKTKQFMLDFKHWDIILFNQLSNKVCSGSYATAFEDAEEFINIIVNHMSNKHNSFKLGMIFTTLYQSSKTSESFGNAITNIRRVLDEQPIEFVIPVGTAIENARTTSLNDLGTSSYDGMTYDGTHLEEGIGCLVASYTSAIKILEIASVFDSSVLAEATVRPDASWIISHNIPGPNWDGSTVLGITDANCYLAQKSAIQAIKYPEKITEIL